MSCTNYPFQNIKGKMPQVGKQTDKAPLKTVPQEPSIRRRKENTTLSHKPIKKAQMGSSFLPINKEKHVNIITLLLMFILSSSHSLAMPHPLSLLQLQLSVAQILSFRVPVLPTGYTEILSVIDDEVVLTPLALS